MVNPLDEVTGPTSDEGRDTRVIQKQLEVKVDGGTKFFFNIGIWILGVVIALVIGFASSGDILTALGISVLGVIPGIIFLIMKTQANAFLLKLEQKIQADTSQIDTYEEQRVLILQDLAKLLDKSVDLDKDVMKSVAAFRAGSSTNTDEVRNETSRGIDSMFGRINVAFEAYPDLKAQANIAEAMRQNAYLQKEITAARVLLNDTMRMWNQEIYGWPVKQMVAEKKGYTTRIPYTISMATKERAKGTFF